jgi:hypothetical protein
MVMFKPWFLIWVENLSVIAMRRWTRTTRAAPHICIASNAILVSSRTMIVRSRFHNLGWGDRPTNHD